MPSIQSLPTETLLDIFSSLPSRTSTPALLSLSSTCTSFTPLAQSLLNRHVTLSHLSSAKQWLESEVGQGVSRTLEVEEDPVGGLGEGWQERWIERCVEKTGGRLERLRLGKLRCELDVGFLEMDELANLRSLDLLTAIGDESDAPCVPFSLKHLGLNATTMHPSLLSALLASSPNLESLTLTGIFTRVDTPSSTGRRASSPFEEKLDPFWVLDAALPCLAGLRELTLLDTEPAQAKLADGAIATFLSKCAGLKKLSTHLLSPENMGALPKSLEELRILPKEGEKGVWHIKKEASPRLKRVVWVDRTREDMEQDVEGAAFLKRCEELKIEVAFEEIQHDVFGDAILDRQ